MYSNTGQEVLFKNAFDAPPRAARLVFLKALCLKNIFAIIVSPFHFLKFLEVHLQVPRQPNNGRDDPTKPVNGGD